MASVGKVWPECRFPEGICITSLYTAFEETYDEHYIYCGESHDFWEVVFAPDSPVGVTAGEDAFVLQPGQMILHPPFEFHRVWADSGVRPHVVILSFQADHFPVPRERVFSLSKEQKKEIFAILDSFRKNCEFDTVSVCGPKPGKLFKVQQTIKRFEYFLICLLGQESVSALPVSPEAVKYREIVTLLEKNLQKNLSLQEIAKECGMSLSSLKKIFSKYTGMGLKRYFNERKIQKAVEMLREGCSVKETAYALGFEDPNYFSTVFKRLTGISPVSCRRAQASLRSGG